MIGKQISHHKIEREIGRGGMGVVYLATDVRLGRQVADGAVLDLNGGAICGEE